MKFLLTGGLGYFGGRLSAHLAGAGHDVVVTTRRPRSGFPSVPAGVRIASMPGNDPGALTTLLADAQALVYLAFPNEIESQADPQSAVEGAVAAFQRTLELVSAVRPECLVVFLSTFHVYGKNAHGRVHEGVSPSPVHPYALAHLKGEEALESFRRRGLKGVSLRLSNSFGAPARFDVPRWTLVVNDLCRQAVRDGRLVLKTAGMQKRNMITLTDAARAVEFLVEHPDRWPADGVINVGSALNLSIRELAERVADVAGLLLGRRPEISAPPAEGGAVDDLVFDVSRLREMGFQWTDEADAEIRATIELCRQAGAHAQG